MQQITQGKQGKAPEICTVPASNKEFIQVEKTNSPPEFTYNLESIWGRYPYPG